MDAYEYHTNKRLDEIEDRIHFLASLLLSLPSSGEWDDESLRGLYNIVNGFPLREP